MVPAFSQGSPPGAVRAVTSAPGAVRAVTSEIHLNKADKIEAVRAMNDRIVGHQVEVLGLCLLCQEPSKAARNHSRSAIPKEGRR
jgi:hypothetical protein